MLLLCALVVGGASSVWADTYTIGTIPSGWSTSGGNMTMNGIKWSYSSATHISLNSSKIQIGSKNNPQTSAWTIQTAVSNFGSGKKITSIAITAYTTATTATYDISAGGSSVKSGSLTTSSNTYTASSLNVTSGDIVITLTGSSTSKAMYLSNISVTYEDNAVAITSIAFDEPKTASVGIGGTVSLTPTVLPAAYTESVDWESDATGVATVSSAGVVTGVAAGTAHITAKAHDNPSTIYDVCTVTVTAPVAVTGVSLNKSETSIEAGSTETLTATISPADATNKNVTWESDDKDVATVENGVVTAVAEGSATITVKSVADPTKTATCAVTVTPAPGSASNPYTVAQARAKIDTGTDLNGKYVHGIISQVDSYNSTYKSITYWISDDGTTTNQFEVYGGLKSENNESGSFSSKEDLQVGDIVTVYGDLTKYSSTYELNLNNYIVSFKRKSDNDLTVTSSTPVALERTSAQPSPTSTITWTATSTGAITCTSSDETVATVTNAGVITAVGEGSATITISQATDDDYKAGETTVTVNVTDNRSAVATGIDLPAAQKTLTVDDMDDFAATSTIDAGFTGTVTYTYTTSDATVVDVAGTTFSAEAAGTATITITATPTGGNAANYKPASQEVAVTVNGTNSISLDLTSKSVAYGAAAFNIVATVPTANYDGTVTASSSNTAVATVSVDGTTVTVTPVVVGTATITVTAGTGTYYPTTASADCAVTVTAPAGSTTAPSSEVTYTFDFTDNTGWEFPTDYTTGENTYTKGGKTITLNTPDDSNGYKFNTNVLLFGKSGATLTLPAFDKPVTKISTSGKSGASSKVSQNIFVGETAVSTETTDATKDHEYTISSSYQEAGTIYTLKVTNGNNTQIPTLTVHMYQAPTATVTLNKYGFATYCSVNPMDFTTTEGYTAWRVSNVSGDGTITFEKITEAIKGGQGVLLYNKDADEVNTSNVTVTFADSDTEFTSSENKLVGTTAPTYVAAESYFGLKANAFVPVNAGTVPAGKALLPYIPESGIKSFTFIFNDSETGITETRTVSREVVETIFDLNGRRLSQPQKGINIVNGRKVVVK